MNTESNDASAVIPYADRQAVAERHGWQRKVNWAVGDRILSGWCAPSGQFHWSLPMTMNEVREIDES